MSHPPQLSPEEAGLLPAHHSDTLQRWPDIQWITCAERVVIVAAESRGFHARVLRRLKLEGYRPTEIELQSLFDAQPIFDANRMVFLFLEASSDKELLHQLLHHLYQQWSETCHGVAFTFWTPGFSDRDTFRLFGLEGETWPDATYHFEVVSRHSSERNEETITELLYRMTRYP